MIVYDRLQCVSFVIMLCLKIRTIFNNRDNESFNLFEPLTDTVTILSQHSLLTEIDVVHRQAPAFLCYIWQYNERLRIMTIYHNNCPFLLAANVEWCKMTPLVWRYRDPHGCDSHTNTVYQYEHVTMAVGKLRLTTVQQSTCLLFVVVAQAHGWFVSCWRTWHCAKAELCDCCCLSVVLSFCERDNSRTRLRMSTKHDGRRRDPLEMVKFCCWSGSECGSRISFSLSVTLGDRTYYTICCHSPEDDTAAALVEFALSEHMLFCVYFPYVGNEVCIFDLTYYKLAPPFVSHLFPSGTDSGRPNRAFDQSISWWRRCWIKNSGLSMTSWRHRDHVTSHLQRHLSYVVRDGRSSKRLYCSLLP